MPAPGPLFSNHYHETITITFDDTAEHVKSNNPVVPISEEINENSWGYNVFTKEQKERAIQESTILLKNILDFYKSNNIVNDIVMDYASQLHLSDGHLKMSGLFSDKKINPENYSNIVERYMFAPKNLASFYAQLQDKKTDVKGIKDSTVQYFTFDIIPQIKNNPWESTTFTQDQKELLVRESTALLEGIVGFYKEKEFIQTIYLDYGNQLFLGKGDLRKYCGFTTTVNPKNYPKIIELCKFTPDGLNYVYSQLQEFAKR